MLSTAPVCPCGVQMKQNRVKKESRNKVYLLCVKTHAFYGDVCEHDEHRDDGSGVTNSVTPSFGTKMWLQSLRYDILTHYVPLGRVGWWHVLSCE